MKGSVSTKAFDTLPEWARKPAAKMSPPHKIVKSTSASDLNRHNLPEHWKTKEQRGAEESVRSRRLPGKLKVRPFPRGAAAARKGPEALDQEPATSPTATTAPGPPAHPAAASDDEGAARDSAARKEHPDYLVVDMSGLPIDDFDDSTYEHKTPAEWLADGPHSGQAPLYLNTVWKWMPCDISEYSEEQRRYRVKFRFNQREKWVKRLNLKFDGEDEVQFRNRLKASSDARDRAVARMRFDHFIARQTDKIVNRVTEECLETIGERIDPDLVSNSIRAAQEAAEVAKEMNQVIGPPLISRLVTEVDKLHTRALKKGIVEYRLPREPLFRAHYIDMGLSLPPAPAPPPLEGMVPLPEFFAFEDVAHNVHRGLSWLRYQGAAPTVQWLHESFEAHFADASMVLTTFGEGVQLPMKVADFADLQKRHCESMLSALSGWKWRRGLLDRLMDDVKGFEFYENTLEKHLASECNTFLHMIELHMAEQLRCVIRNTVADLLSMLKRYDPLHAESSYEATQPIFSLKLKDSVHGSTPTVIFAARVAEVEACLQQALQNVVTAIGEVSAVDAEILTVLQLDSRPILQLGVGDPICGAVDQLLQDAAKEISAFVDRAFEAPRSLARKYDVFLPVLHVTPEAFLDSVVYLTEAEILAREEAARKAARKGEKETEKKESQREGEEEEEEEEEDEEEDSSGDDEEGRERQREMRPLEGIKTFLTGEHDRIDQILQVSYNVEVFNVTSVDCQELKETLTRRCRAFLEALHGYLITEAKSRNKSIDERYEAILERLSQPPTNEEELVALSKFQEDSKEQLEQLMGEVDECFERLDTLGINLHRLPWESFQMAWTNKTWPKRLHKAREATQKAIDQDRQRMLDLLEKDKEEFERDLEDIQVAVEESAKFDDIEQLQRIYDAVSDIEQRLTNATAQAEQFKRREAAFELPESEYGQIAKMERDFEPYSKLWMMTYDFRSNKDNWINGPFNQLDASKVSKDVNSWWTQSYKLNKMLSDSAPGAAEVAAQLRTETTEFKKNVPLIDALGTPALCERHWIKLSELIEYELVPDDELTLKQMVDMDIMQHYETIEMVTQEATKEFNLAKNLQAMQDEWAETAFTVVAYKESGTYVVGGTDDIITLLDDQIVKAQTMLGSPYIIPVKPECKQFETKLTYIQSLIDKWLAVQRGWMYLEPIFSSPDIMRQMPTEGRRFQSIDSLWRSTLAKALEDPLVMTVAENDKLLASMQAASHKLDQIQKGLNDYLETKALVFPRFFFLANEELLEILSQTKDPRAVQPYLGKCFEGIGKIKFAGDDKGDDAKHVEADDVLQEMRSVENELVPLIAPVDPNQGKKKGNVEIWLLELESSMRLTVKGVVENAMNAYAEVERKQWVLKWPGQVILCVGGLYWTKEVEDALSAGGLRGIEKYYEKLDKQLTEIVQLVRGKLKKLERKALGALTVVDVHQKDVVRDLVKEKVTSVDNFAWMAQLRYYWQDKPDDYDRYGKDPHNLLARIINAEQMYGYEYLGCSSRLIITPLTDRCYRTLMGATSLMYGGAPAGPAGTGKTETTKDLAKAVAIQCVVMNCSDGLDFRAMAKFFKGLAQSGAWACFDEFNRIELEVLSVIAQQILTITKAKMNRVARFTFEGTNLSLNPDCNVFITMNPGYAGRSELPDNLQALFRPCAMMVPDYALIAEIMLYSFGFQDGLTLARKLTQVLKLASELLSNQKHYDYGMRAVFSILVRAGALRQSRGDTWSEDWIVLSAVMDVNLPKFTSEDLPLFRGITSDLFPGVTLPKPEYGELIPEIERQCVAQKLQAEPNYVGAIVQLFETVQVRHGLMVVGLTMSGKSGVFSSLARAMTKLKDYETVKRHIMNPKSVTQGQLYGNFDENTHEWSDGILAVLYRLAAKDSVNRNWVTFDGPVDAVWIENMNTVLDDNKKLCLVSGEIIKMSPTMTMMFETEDLEEASPATVSRVGMVYMQPSRLGETPLLESWIQFKMPKCLEKHGDTVRSLFHWLYLPLRYCLRNSCTLPTPITNMELAKNLLVMFSTLLHDPFNLEGGKVPKEKDIVKALECAFLTACTWSLGVVVDEPSRKIFDHYFRQLFMGHLDQTTTFEMFSLKNPAYEFDSELAATDPIPEDGVVYDYAYDVGKLRWVAWASEMKQFKVSPDASYSSILVPTLDTYRNQVMMERLVLRGEHVLITGDTGTGKSVQVKQLLTTVLNREVYQPLYLNFSAQTSQNMTQDIVDGKLGKRRKGVFGPPPEKKCVVFVDDLNMPAKEEYGAQPPIEILRQWMCQGGWYDRKELVFRNLVDLQFLAAMGPPGGGRTQISQRYVRHFLMINLVPFDDASLTRVFSTILQWHMGRAGFSPKVKACADKLVAGSVALYNNIAANLLPTPLKSHYTFNLRDLSKVFQGICLSNGEDVQDVPQAARLWVHESQRVFADRLVDDADRVWFQTAVEEQLPLSFVGLDWKKVKGANDTLIYGNYIDMRALIEKRRYVEIEDHEKLEKVMLDYLEDYNAMNTTRMELVLFMNAIEHLSRIARVIQLPGGNALLVGVGGSGRKSLTSLAIFLAEMTLFQISISKQYGMTEWRDDLKRMFLLAGCEKKNTVFLFSDTQVVLEGFIEDINNILNTGEVPNIFEQEDKIQIIEDLTKDAKAAKIPSNPTAMMAFFTQRVVQHLHIVLAFSPIGETFRRRLLMFPSLVNCCTIDWFAAWPPEALRSVAKQFLANVDLEEKAKEGVILTCVDMQSRVRSMTNRFRTELQRHYHVTPTSYLELINTFKNLIATKRGEVLESKSRYENGLEKLRQTGEQVAGMEEQLTALQPKLKEASIATEAKLKEVKAAQEVAGVEKGKVEVEEKACNEQAKSAGAQKAECEEMLAEAIPALEAAISALKTLSKADIVEIKNLGKPPAGIRLTMEVVCIMFGKKPKRIPNPDGKGKIDDYWEVSQKDVLKDTQFLQKLMDFDKDNMDEKMVEKVKKYTARDDFTPDVIFKQSRAAAGVCKWVHAMVTYDRVAKIVKPKKEALAIATNELAEAKANLAIKQGELQKVMDQLAQLQRELDETEAKKVELANKVEDCANKLDRANRLMNGLGGERARWTEFVKELQITFDNIVGDIVLSAGAVAYLGVFTAGYRDEAIAAWSGKLRDSGITCAEAFDLTVVLGEPVHIRQWTIDKLPNDQFSISNAIMLKSSNRWPLMIDPQGQANKWVRMTHKDDDLKVVKQSQGEFVRTLENAINFGSPVLLENVPEALDPVLETILKKQIVKVGGTPQIQVGDNMVDYDESFSLYITTKLSNPHYPPETCVQVNLLNFMATKDGLQDQMLGVTVKMETPELEEKRERLVLQDAENKRALKEIEDTILKLLKEAKGNILDDETLINTLAESNVKSKEINIQVEEAKKISAEINRAREQFEPIAFRVSSLFFCIADLANVDPMYQYSLESYINFYLIAIERAAKSDIVETRLENLSTTFTSVLYQNICRSLFEKDKLLFSMLLCFRIMTGEGNLDAAELRYFLQGNSAEATMPNPCEVDETGTKWMSDYVWAQITGLESLAAFEGFTSWFTDRLEQWRGVFNSGDPSQDVDGLLGKDRYTMFQRLIVLKCVRPDGGVAAVMEFVKENIGPEFIDPPPFDVKAGYDDSTCVSPLLFVLTAGADPMTVLLKLAEELGFGQKLHSVSLGQGQGPIAEHHIMQAKDTGKWVCLQNVHLAVSWMPTLEKLCEEFTPEMVHHDFRLWLTSMPSDKFPVLVLQNGVKMTLEPPKGIRSNMQGSYVSIDPDWLEASSKPHAFKKMVFGICFFHAIVRERCKFGPIGWKIPYTFSAADLRITLDQLQVFLDTYDEIPFDTLCYLTSECNYGGRVTDDKDRRYINYCITDYYTADILDDAYKFSPSGTYVPPSSDLKHAGFLDFVRNLPYTEGPEVFGMHDNAGITCANQGMTLLLDTALSLQPKTGGGAGKSWSEQLDESAKGIEARLPEDFDIEKVTVLYPVKFEESMNTVLTMELVKFNRLLSTMKAALAEVQRALVGITVMSPALEAMGNSMVNGWVPAMWAKVAYPSLKPLASWVSDLEERLKFFDLWIQNGKPAIFWISGFFFTPSFLTGTRQNYARKHKIAIDELDYDFAVVSPEATAAIKEPAADGVYIRGLFLEGAGWNVPDGVLVESQPKVLYIPVPVIWLIATKTADIDLSKHSYACPVYKTSERKGVLSTTGHSTNFVLFIRLPMKEEHTQKHWIRRGVAMLTQLDT